MRRSNPAKELDGFKKKAIIQLLIGILGIVILVVGFIMFMITGSVPIVDSSEANAAVFESSLVIMSFSGMIFVGLEIWSFVEGVMFLSGHRKVDGRGQPLILIRMMSSVFRRLVNNAPVTSPHLPTYYDTVCGLLFFPD